MMLAEAPTTLTAEAAHLEVPMGAPVIVAAEVVTPAELTLAGMAQQLETQLGLRAGLPLMAVVEQAVEQLGLESR